MRWILRIVLNAVAIAAAAAWVPGVSLGGPGAALVAGLILGLVNALVKPVLVVLTLPFTILTLGLFLFVVNAVCLGLTAALVPGFGIRGFGPALLAALVVTLVSWILNGIVLRPLERSARL